MSAKPQRLKNLKVQKNYSSIKCVNALQSTVVFMSLIEHILGIYYV